MDPRSESNHRPLQRRPRVRGRAERAAFLDAECGRDVELRAEVESLLAAHQAGRRRFSTLRRRSRAGSCRRPKAPGRSRARCSGPTAWSASSAAAGWASSTWPRTRGSGGRWRSRSCRRSSQPTTRRKERLRLEARAAAALSDPAIATVFSLEELDGRLVPRHRVCEGRHPPVRDRARAALAGPRHRDRHPGGARAGGGPRRRRRAPRPEAGQRHPGPARAREDPRLRDRPPRRAARRVVAAPHRRPGWCSARPATCRPSSSTAPMSIARTDIFALGVLLYEIAAGVHPFAGPTPAATVANVYAANPPRLTALDGRLPPRLDAVVRKCLRRHRTERYSSALDVARDLQDAARRHAAAARCRRGAAGAVEPALVVAPPPAVRDPGRERAGLHRLARALAVRQDWTLALLLADIATVAINGTLRVHLLFTSAFNDSDMRGATPPRDAARARDRPRRRAAPADRGGRRRSARTLFLSSTLAAFGVGWAVVSLMVEPATRKAAFGQPRTDRSSLAPTRHRQSPTVHRQFRPSASARPLIVRPDFIVRPA